MSKGTVVTANVNYILENKIKILKGLPLIQISKLKLHPNNIKSHPQEQVNNLTKLIQMIGFKDPIVIDKQGEVKAGHGRLLAAQELGMTRVPYIPLEGLTKKQMDLFMYMDNQVNESPWIDDNVQLLLQDMPAPVLENFEVNWDDIITAEPEEESEEIPELPITPKTILGDIYLLGNHRVMCGDATNDVQILLQGKTPPLTFTDPPFNINYSGIKQKHKKIENDNMDKEEFEIFLTESLKSISKTSYVCCNWKSYAVFEKILNKIGSTVKACIVWDKEIPAQNLDKYFKEHEFILYCGKLGGEKTIRGDIWRLKRERSKLHPTSKPVELCSMAITDSSKRNDIVFDPFLGSGSTLIACEQTNRICYGMELDPSYVDVIITRWENYTGKKAKLLK